MDDKKEEFEEDFAEKNYFDDDYGDDEAASLERGMTFLEHLEEFRWTVAKSLLAFIIGVTCVLIFISDIAAFLQMPLSRAYGSAELMQENLKTYRPMGVLSVFIQIALLGGLSLSMPFALYFLGNFVAPGLTDKERRLLRPACFAAFILFLSGVAFAFFLILPVTLGFFVRLREISRAPNPFTRVNVDIPRRRRITRGTSARPNQHRVLPNQRRGIRQRHRGQ
mgnify:CR=1 FL=1